MTELLTLIANEAIQVEQTAARLRASLSIDPEQILSRDLKLQSPTHISSNGSCRLLEAADGWIAINLAREDDRIAVPAWLDVKVDSDDWSVIAELVSKKAVEQLKERALMLHMPFAIVGETGSRPPEVLYRRRAKPWLAVETLRILDMSALWAGPLCGAIFAECGAQVTKLESIGRRDPMGVSSPQHDLRLNGKKQRIVEQLSVPTIDRYLADSDVLITSGRPHALDRLGLEPETVFATYPGLLWIAITAYGWRDDAAMRVGFGDDCAAAGGLTQWIDGVPRFIGDALADPLTGLVAARHGFTALADGQRGLIDCALAPTAAYFAEQLS